MAHSFDFRSGRDSLGRSSQWTRMGVLRRLPVVALALAIMAAPTAVAAGESFDGIFREGFQSDIPDACWQVDSSRSFLSRFGSAFDATTPSSLGVVLDLRTWHDPDCLSQTRNELQAFRFSVGDSDDEQAFGAVLALLHHAHGGTQWFFISEGHPADIGMLRLPGSSVFDPRCAGYGSINLAWMKPDATIPPGMGLPPASSRCVLEPGRTYYLNVVFFHLQQLVTTGTQINSCARTVTNPPLWNCVAYLRRWVN